MLNNPNSQQIATGPRRRCDHCGYFPLEPLATFNEADISSGPTVDSYVPSGTTALLSPLWSLFAMFFSWFGKVAFEAAKVKKAQLKVRSAKAEVLSRNPNALICPRCYDVLEVM